MIKNILNKKVIIIGIGIVIVGVIIWLILSKSPTNDIFYSSESKYSNDSITAMNDLFQSYEKSKAKFYVYGEETLYTKNKMIVECDGTSSVVELSATPIIVDNHCVLSYDLTTIKNKNLITYVVSPDNSLIAIKPNFKTKLQVNAYQNETRIVLQEGNIYSRIAKQKENSKFTIQVANTIFESIGGQEVGTVSQIVDGKATYTLDDTGLISYGDKYYEKIESSLVIGIANFRVINGSSNYRKRGTDDNSESYKDLIYYLDNGYNSLALDEDDIVGLKDLYGDYTEHLNELVDDQEELNKNDELHFIGIVRDEERVRDKDRTKKVMDEYAKYWTAKNNENNDNKSGETTSSNQNNGNACDIYKSITGWTPTGICWCRNDFPLSSNGIGEINSKGYSFSVSDFIYCHTFTLEDTGGGMGQSTEGFMLKECAIELGWPENSYSNEGGYSCN